METTPRNPRRLRARSLWPTVLAIALFAGAWLAPVPAAALDEDAKGGFESGERPALRAEAQRRLRTYRALALAEYLDLDEEKALAMNAVISRYDEKRREIQVEISGHMRTLRLAATQDEPDAEEVDAAVEGILSARSRLEALRGQEARELLGGLDPQRQARLFVFFREFPREVRRMMREGRGGPREVGRERRGDPSAPPPGPRRPGRPGPPGPRPPPNP